MANWWTGKCLKNKIQIPCCVFSDIKNRALPYPMVIPKKITNMKLTYKIFSALIIACFSWAFSIDPEPNAPLLYEKYCMQCHGKTGAKGSLGVKKLNKSTLDEAAIRTRIQLGKKRMPAFESVLSPIELDALVRHVKAFQK